MNAFVLSSRPSTFTPSFTPSSKKLSSLHVSSPLLQSPYADRFLYLQLRPCASAESLCSPAGLQKASSTTVYHTWVDRFVEFCHLSSKKTGQPLLTMWSKRVDKPFERIKYSLGSSYLERFCDLTRDVGSLVNINGSEALWMMLVKESNNKSLSVAKFDFYNYF